MGTGAHILTQAFLEDIHCDVSAVHMYKCRKKMSRLEKERSSNACSHSQPANHSVKYQTIR